jgi:hypothetical protein
MCEIGYSGGPRSSDGAPLIMGVHRTWMKTTTADQATEVFRPRNTHVFVTKLSIWRSAQVPG